MLRLLQIKSWNTLSKPKYSIATGFLQLNILDLHEYLYIFIFIYQYYIDKLKFFF